MCLTLWVHYISDERQIKKKTIIGRYVIIALILLITLIGINKFIFTRGFDVFDISGSKPSKAALAYYFEKSGTSADAEEVSAMLRRFGCHQEIHVYKNDQLVMKATYANGQIYEIE